MANMHALDARGNQFRVAMHFPAPAGTNSAGIAWATVIQRAGRFGTTILADGDGAGGTIAAAERAQILACTVLECVVDVLIESATAGERGPYLDALYAQKQLELNQTIQRELKWFGLVR